jgi:hypothetical protein
MSTIQDLLTKKPYLAWYINNKNSLSDESTLEHILNYGNWEDYLEAENILGITKTKSIFNKLINKKRINLRPQTVNYFQNYFAKYA